MPELIQTTVLSATFIGAIAQDNAASANIPIPMAIGSQGRCRLNSLVLLAEENLSYEIHVWASATHGATVDTDQWLGRWTFLASDAVIITGDALLLYRYFIPDLDLAYEDTDAVSSPNPAKLHISLVPRGAAKTINKKIVLKFFLAPETAYA